MKASGVRRLGCWFGVSVWVGLVLVFGVSSPVAASPLDDASPSSAGMPGGALVVDLLSWGMWLGLAASGAAVLFGAATWAGFGSASAGRAVQGKTYVIAGLIGALVIGLAPTAISMLFDAGQSMSGRSVPRGLRSRPAVWLLVVVLAVGALWSAATRLFAADATSTTAAVPVRVVGPVGGGDVDVSQGAGLCGVGGGGCVPAGPVRAVWGVPVGYGRSERGAQAAAVGWVASLGQLMRLGPVALRDALFEVMTQRAASETLAEFDAERALFVKSFGADPVLAVWVESPLQFDLVEYSSQRATVDVWSQLVMGVDTDVVGVLWRTQTVTVLWEGDGWRVDDVVRVEGPTPVPVDSVLPSPGHEFATVAAWSPAVAAGSSVEEGAGS